MAISNTPGVYVQEVSTLAPSVAQVATAIPAFVGYTEKGSGVVKIDTLLDYETLFGKAQPSEFNVTVDAQTQEVGKVERTDSATNKFLMYYGLSLYFLNGGGSCYIVSVGNYGSDLSKAKDAFAAGLGLLEKEDEPTLIVLLDAISLLKPADYYDLCVQALGQCEKLGDRFLIVDVVGGDWKTFRDQIGTSNLIYGAAYHPYLQTLLNYQYQEEKVQTDASAADRAFQGESGAKGIMVTYTGKASATPKVTMKVDAAGTTAINFATSVKETRLTITVKEAATGAQVVDAWSQWKSVSGNDAAGFDVKKKNDGSDTIASPSDLVLTAQENASVTLKGLQTTNTALYSKIKLALNEQRVNLPPSPAIAGIYARVDRERGVWKTPANVSVASVIGPVTRISDGEQDGLNVDTTGKSINAIRAFAGKGTLVWGGRTLAGNDNEWRYVSVRRLFITIEESTRKATSFAIFEPNDATTWLKVKAMIESYLYGLWEQGALAGPKPESAYFVKVGLGKTMTTQDILEGRMKVEIGIAAVRPAEFIILRFTHKLQEA